jgi:3-hydroxyacyl-[acyl-carrier-protein] dehydratase
MTNPDEDLHLCADVVQLLIPHRRPLLMVDTVTGYRAEPRLELWANRHVSANEPVFAGHFPGLHLWPGVYTIEGLGQCCNLLLVIDGLQRAFAERGGRPEDLLLLLRNEDLGARLHPGFRPEHSARLREGIAANACRFGFSAGVEVKLLQPVFAGQRLDYRVARTHTVGDLDRFEVEARVDGATVAKGFMSSARRVLGPGLRAP